MSGDGGYCLMSPSTHIVYPGFQISDNDRPWQFLPSCEISNPALQTQWKLPSVFTQRPLLQIRPLATHSSRSGRSKQIDCKHIYPFTVCVFARVRVCVYVTPRHSVLVAVVWNPAGHWQIYEPGVFTHSPCVHGFLSHSSSSGKQTKARKPSLPSHSSIHLAGETLRHSVWSLPMHSPLPSSLKPMLHSQRYPITGVGMHLPFRQRLR